MSGQMDARGTPGRPIPADLRPGQDLWDRLAMDGRLRLDSAGTDNDNAIDTAARHACSGPYDPARYDK